MVQDVAGAAQSLLELVEAGDPQEGVTHDQHRPPLAHHLEALGHRAVHAGEALPFHGTQDRGLHHRTQSSTVSSMTESTLSSSAPGGGSAFPSGAGLHPGAGDLDSTLAPATKLANAPGTRDHRARGPF